MRNRLLTLLSVAFVAISSFAQSWTEPEVPTTASDPVSGHLYRVKNVESGWFVAGGQSFFTWKTTAILVEENPITFTMDFDEAKKGWSFKGYDGSWPNSYLFISGNGIDGYAMHVDNPTDPHRYFEIIKQDNGYYRVRCLASDDTYGDVIENYDNRFWGWNPDTEAQYPNGMYAAVDPEDGYACEWEFIDMSLYFAKKTMYDLAVAILDEELDVNYEQYTTAYNSSDYETVNAAKEALQKAVDMARAYKVLSVGDDGINPPSDDNPCTATSLIKNASFDAGNISGWTCTFESGKNATNVGYQGATHTNGDVSVSQFIEAWAAGDKRFNPDLTYSAIGDGKLSQTMASLPQGKYKFTCDAISVQQHQPAENPVTGVQLFATGGELEQTQNIATGNGLPEHFEITFVSTGGDVEIGLRTKGATANWIAADNFTLTYYGEVVGDPAQILLQSYINECTAKYDVDAYSVKAEKSAKDAYAEAMANAQNATEDFEAYKAALEAAVKNLEESITLYEKLNSTITSMKKQISDAAKDWTGLSEQLADMQASLLGKYNEGTADKALIEALSDSIYNMCADYITKALKEDPKGCIGKEITMLLKNQGFDTGFDSWTINSGATPAYGGWDVPLPEDNPVYKYAVEYTDKDGNVKHIVDGGCAEVYKAAFDISQTIKDMPVGVFELSCQAFERCEDGDKSSLETQAELYAVVNNSTQSTKVRNIHEDAQDEQLYFQEYGGGNNAEPQTYGDVMSGAYPEKWIPNGMCGANVWFRYGLYKNFFNIVVGSTADLTVGIRTNATNGWVLFDDFKITYKGEDIEKYKEMLEANKQNLENLLAEAEVSITDSVSNVVNDALAKADEALAGNEGKACTDAIQALIDAVAAVQQNLKDVAAFSDEFYIMQDYRYNQDGLSGDTPEIMAEIEDRLDPDGNEKFKDNADIEKYRIEMNRAYTQFVQDCLTKGASEEEPADITYVIYNPDCNSYSDVDDQGDPVAIGAQGWNVPVGSVGYGDGGKHVAEFFEQAFEINQTIYGLNPGWYRLYVKGFYRDGNSARLDSCINNVEGFTEDKHVRLMAGETETALSLITSEMKNYTDLLNDAEYDIVTTGNSAKLVYHNTEDEDSIRYIPNKASVANLLFNFDKEDSSVTPWYQNILQFEVKEGQGDVKIGLYKLHNKNVEADAENGIEAYAYGDWTIWDNWKLEFLGTTEPTEDPTTAIMGVDAVAPAKATIYNMAGQRVSKATKGIFIINGKKMVVK